MEIILNRGIFNQLLSEKDYKISSKEWCVELEHSQMYWYDLIQNSHEEFDTKSFIIEKTKEIKRKVEENLEKRFIYFICSRRKVRFCTKTPATLTPCYFFMKLRVLVGRDKIIKEFVINTLHDSFGNPIFPEFDDTGRFISFMDSIQGVNTVLSIHDFLLEFNINLDINTEVHYVGYTKNPHTRPLNGVHGGLTSTLCNVSNEENDILIFFNIFKVMCLAKNKKLNFEFFFS